MSTDTTASAVTPLGLGPRVAVLFEPTANGAAALREGTDLAGADGSVTVVALAPQSLPSRCCGPSVEVLNCAVRDAAQHDLVQARSILGAAADRATFRCLVRHVDPPLPVWLAGEGFDVVVLPARRMSRRGHPLARRLQRATDAEIRIVR